MPTLWRHIETRFAPHARVASSLSPLLLLDLLGAASDLDGTPYAAFGAEHWRRRRRQLEPLVDASSLEAFREESRPLRIQAARILARCHGASAEERLVILACLERALGGADGEAPRVRAAMGVLEHSGLAMLHDLVDLVHDALCRAVTTTRAGGTTVESGP